MEEGGRWKGGVGERRRKWRGGVGGRRRKVEGRGG